MVNEFLFWCVLSYWAVTADASVSGRQRETYGTSDSSWWNNRVSLKTITGGNERKPLVDCLQRKYLEAMKEFSNTLWSRQCKSILISRGRFASSEGSDAGSLHMASVRLPNSFLSLRRTIRALFCPTLCRRVRVQFVDQQEHSCWAPWSKQTGAWTLSVPAFSSAILFGIITPVVQGLIPAETWEPGTRGLQRSSVEREGGVRWHAGTLPPTSPWGAWGPTGWKGGTQVLSSVLPPVTELTQKSMWFRKIRRPNFKKYKTTETWSRNSKQIQNS